VPPRRKKRLDPSIFQLPVEALRAGVYAARQVNATRELLRGAEAAPRVLLQLSATHAGWLAGIDEAVAILKLGADDWGELSVHAMYEGDRLDGWDTVLTIEGTYHAFVHLEPLLLGVLERRTRVHTNVRRLVEAARPKSILVAPAAHDHWLLQPGDGWAVRLAGADAILSEAAASWTTGAPPVAIVSHALVAVHGGDVTAAARALAGRLGDDVRLLAPAAHRNDSVAASLALARALPDRLWGIVLDTPSFLVDQAILPQMGAFDPTGVNPQLVWMVRNALDTEGFGDVKLVAAGGFDAARIRRFEQEAVPVDCYAVGGAVFDGRSPFVADVVEVNGEPAERVGRPRRPNPKLERVK
jgi:nicotinate phosphoribosyltransferase